MKIIITDEQIHDMKEEIDVKISEYNLVTDIRAESDIMNILKESLAVAILSGNSTLSFAAFTHLKRMFDVPLSNLCFKYKADCWAAFCRWCTERADEIKKGLDADVL